MRGSNIIPILTLDAADYLSNELAFLAATAALEVQMLVCVSVCVSVTLATTVLKL